MNIHQPISSNTHTSEKMLHGILSFDSHPFGTQNKHIQRGEIRLDFTKMDYNLCLLLFSYGFI